MKTAYAFNPQSLIFTGAVPIALIAGYSDYIKPKFALWEPVPEHDKETQQCRADLKNQTWIVEAKPQKVTAYHKATLAEKEFSDASEVTDDYTVNKPPSPFHEWTPKGWKYSQEKERPQKTAIERQWRDRVLAPVLQRIEQFERDQNIAEQYRTSPLNAEHYEMALADRKALCDYPSTEGFPFCERPVLSAVGQALEAKVA